MLLLILFSIFGSLTNVINEETSDLDENGNPVGDGSAFQTKADFDAKVGEEGNVQKAAMTEIDGLNEVITVRENAIFDTLDATTQDAINKKVKNSKGTKTRCTWYLRYRPDRKSSCWRT